MSGGEQQRAAIARALMNNPQLLLADEPTGNLDPHTADGVADMLFKLVKTENLALLMVTHNPALAKRCHRTLHMNDGILK
jgi:predicted ABC-type transport system involved in lysophospholipase L1 biosynthesis ATPase subunit